MPICRREEGEYSVRAAGDPVRARASRLGGAAEAQCSVLAEAASWEGKAVEVCSVRGTV